MAINNIEQVKWIVHKILPAVYDEALSYYEVLCKVIAKLNEVIANEDEQNEMLVDFDERLSDVEEAVSEIESDIRGEITDVLKTYNGYANGKFLGVSGDEIKWVNMPTVITSYDSLSDKPQINGVTLAGNKTSAQLNIKQIPAGGVVGQVLKKLSDNDYDVAWGSSGGGGGGGTTDYTDLENKPQINGVTLAGNKSTADLSLGDMKKADYDSDSAVDDAGGIAAYVDSAIGTGTSGLMGEADYDDDEIVKDAGGIVPYVESKVVASIVQNFPEDSDFDVVMENADNGEVASTVIFGKTVTVNQLIPATYATTTLNDITITNNGNGSFRINGIATANTDFYISSVSLIEGHKYAILGFSGGNNTTWSINIQAIGGYYEETIIDYQFATTDRYVFPRIYNGANVDVTIRPQFIDLTLIFNSDELTAIGTDVSKLKTAWLKKYGYPLPQYISYNSGSLANVNGVYRLQGRNIWGEEWELGVYNLTTGEKGTGSSNIRCKNLIPVSPNTTYYFKAPKIFYGLFYDTNATYIGKLGTNGWQNGNTTFTTPSNCSFFAFYMYGDYGTTYQNDICINLSDSSFNGNYEAYYDGGEIDCSNAPLNGVGTVHDEIDYASGKRTTKCGMIDLGTINWSYSNGRFDSGSNIPNCKQYAMSVLPNMLCAKYKLLTGSEFDSGTEDKVFRSNDSTSSTTGRIFIRDSAYTDAAAFKTAMNGVMLCYELATPTTATETAQPVYTQDGYNVLEPISGDVQSANVNATYLHLLGGLFSRKADLVNGKVPDSQLPDFGEANVINFDSIVSGTTTIPSDDRTKLSDMTKPCEIHIGTAVYHRATPFRFYWEQKGTVLNVIKILEINSSTYIITETTMFASYATTSTNKGIPETGTNGVWKLVANKTVASDSANTGFTYTELLGGNYDEYMIVVKGKAKGNVSILNTNSGGTSLSNTITYREGTSTTISNNQSAIPATNGNYFEATLTLKNYISFGSGNGGYFALEGNVCDGDSSTQSTYFIQCAWKIAYAGTYNIGFNNLAKDSEIRLYGRNTGDYVFPNPL